MDERRCRYCEKTFQPSKYQQRQAVCGEPPCQQQRKREYRQRKLVVDTEYRQVCQDSAQKWRARNPGYWKQYREKKPEAADRNREQQRVRDRAQRLRDLANNTSALDLKHSAAGVWLLSAGSEDLANNNLASAQVWVIETLPRRKGPGRESCKQQRAGAAAASA